MFWKKNKVVERNFPEKMAKRVNKIASADIPGWIEQSLSETNRSLSAYMKTQSEDSLKEMLIGAEAVNCLVSELYNRNVI